MKNKFLYIVVLLLLGCVDPIAPEFEYKEGLIFIDAFAATSEGASFVNVSESVLNRDRFSNVFIKGAEVSFINTNTGTRVMLVEQEDIYVPPSNFVASAGESWELEVNLADGRHYQSLSETVLEPVAINDINATYKPELLFREASEGFVPGHSVSVSLNDPSDRENYYYWRFRSFEELTLCKICENGILRNGICEENPQGSNRSPFYTYFCDSECWQIRFNENVKIFADDFTNGTTINQLPIADVLLYTKADILIEVQQFSLSIAAYKYYKTLKDIIDNNGGFNAPPPAALIGNMFNPNDSEEFVLGRFTAASSSIASVFIDRSDISEALIEGSIIIQTETSPPVFPELSLVYTAPCVESRFRTGIRPEGWVD